MTGAACLSAMAAFRADAGYVTLAVPQAALPAAEALALEPVKVGWSDANAVETIVRAAERATALAIGPGLGRSAERGALVRDLLGQLRIPAVVDADALFALERFERDAPTVLTPHAGELARLLETDSDWVNAHRLAAAQQGADRYGAIVLLKGADTIVAAPTPDVRSITVVAGQTLAENFHIDCDRPRPPAGDAMGSVPAASLGVWRSASSRRGS